MAASAASNSAAVCDTSVNSNPPGASSRAIAPASADGGTRTILGIARSPRRKNRCQYAPIRPRHANFGLAAEAGKPARKVQLVNGSRVAGNVAPGGPTGGARKKAAWSSTRGLAAVEPGAGNGQRQTAFTGFPRGRKNGRAPLPRGVGSGAAKRFSDQARGPSAIKRTGRSDNASTSRGCPFPGP